MFRGGVSWSTFERLALFMKFSFGWENLAQIPTVDAISQQAD
jgi:hypothetical protein